MSIFSLQSRIDGFAFKANTPKTRSGTCLNGALETKRPIASIPKANSLKASDRFLQWRGHPGLEIEREKQDREWREINIATSIVKEDRDVLRK